ncbi:PHD finger protein 3 isoform X2 [Amia ocellicauda]|uniref:PHD finger protein 3 isoform X2 n=1 Tax=Amia ocellicauda TaxID=2972642 RepID=UPI003464456E
MDIVDTFNHLIPSDQLDDTLLLGPNLDSEVSDEFGTGHNLEDSLKNMLSDKDPMLGSASTQFHLLDNDEANFHIAGSTVVGLDMMSEGGLKGSGHGAMGDDLMHPGKSQRGRSKPVLGSPRKSPRLMAQEPVRILRQSTVARRSGLADTPAVKKSPMKTVQGRRVGTKQQQEGPQSQDVSDNCSQESLEQSVEPSEMCGKHSVQSSPAAVTVQSAPAEEDGPEDLKREEISQDSLGKVSNAAPLQNEEHSLCQITKDATDSIEKVEVESEPIAGTESEMHFSPTQELVKPAVDGTILSELGPYVNPNEVQEGLGALMECSEAAEQACKNTGVVRKPETEPKNKNQVEPHKPDLSSLKKTSQVRGQDGSESLQRPEANKDTVLGTPKGKVCPETHKKQDQKLPAKKPLKSKPVQSPVKLHKKLLPHVPGELKTGPKIPPPKKARADLQKLQGLKRKQVLIAMKRKADDVKFLPSKIQRTQPGQDVRMVNLLGVAPQKRAQIPSKSPKSPELVRPSVPRMLLPGLSPERFKSQHVGVQAGVSKSVHSQAVTKPHSPQIVVGKSGYVPKEGSEEDEREKPKMKKAEKVLHRQRKSSKSLSLDEPPLFIPDNAPAQKKEAPEEDSTDSETVWDPSKHCGFCKKPHNNRFMVGCGRCDDWFHGECVGLDLAKAQQMEQEDEEYVCLKCCAEEDGKAESSEQQPSSQESHSRPEQHQENKPAVKHEKQGQAFPTAAGVNNPNSEASEKPSPLDDRKHKVRIFRKDSVERRPVAEHKEIVERRMHTIPHKMGQTVSVHQPSGEGRSHVDTGQKPGTTERQDLKRAKVERFPVASPTASKKPSVEQIRRNVRESLKDILVKRLSESDLKISTERAAKVALKTERELFSFFRDTDTKYKSKYRSLMFNLKDAKNNVLFKRVLKGEITPDHLIRMSPEELASKELAAWRQRENRHTIEMIEKEQREVERRPITKITHKGEIEIENQEPVKEPEPMEVEEPVSKPPEEPEEVPDETELESSKDTTSQHKKHLFDLNCKICTGRMAPPVEDAPTKIVKVATTVVRRQSSAEGEAYADSPSTQPDILAFSALEESKAVTSKGSFSAEGRSEASSSGEDEATFLARLESLWKGFINMPSVAKFVTKAYPLSGILDHLTEDLPDSIQVGGRISPQTVWDYVEKIRASGTKEVCLIRFAPVTEEDEISYTLLYAYFSSRKRYGVVANNMKQVKDMYLIPLGSGEKIPHHLVPFDGPGLEAKRPNLLLGLIIRQRVKRDFGVVLPLEVPETSSSRIIPEKRAKTDLTNESEDGPDGQNDFLNSLKVVLPKQVGKSQPSTQDVAEEAAQPNEETPAPVEGNLQESAKPLRFLPGVLVGWDSQSSLDLASKPLPVDDILQSLLGTTDKLTMAAEGAASETVPSKSPASTGTKPAFIVKKKEAKTVKLEYQSTSPNDKIKLNESSGMDHSSASSVSSAVLLKDKPPDVSTEAFLANVAIAQASRDQTVAERKADNQMEEPQKAKPKTESPSVAAGGGNANFISMSGSNIPAEEPSTSKPSVFSSPIKDPRQTVGRILKTSPTQYKSEKQSFNDNDGQRNTQDNESYKAENVPSGSQGNPGPREHNQVFNVPVLNMELQCSSTRTMAAQQSYSYQQSTNEMQNIATISTFSKGAGLNLPMQGHLQPPGVFSQGGPLPPPANFPPVHTSGPEFQYHPVPLPGFPVQSNAVPSFQPQQMPPNYGFPRAPPPVFHQPEPECQNHAALWSTPTSHPPNFPPQHTLPGPSIPYEPPRFGGSSKPPPAKEDKAPERRYSDPWDRQPQQSDDSYKRDRGDHHSRQRFYSESHHDRKGREHDRDHDRDRGKHWEHNSEKGGHRERSHSRDEKSRERHRSHEDRHRERQPSYGGEHSRGDRYHERPRDRHHSDEREKNRERERDRHKKDSDYEKGNKVTKEKSKDDKHL